MEDLQELKPVYSVQNIISKFCYTIGMLPSSYKIALTYEEQILAIGHYLETTVYPAINNNAEALVELQNLFLDLKNYVDNYFENLDIQEEINKKLDEMADSGQLQNLISSYLSLNGLLIFENVESLKNSLNLINGATCKTLGYYSKNDKGGALYYITSGDYEDDNASIIELQNNLYAILVHEENGININQFGCKVNDENFNNHDNIIKALNYAYNNKIPNINFMEGIYYTTPLSFYGLSQLNLIGCSAKYYSDFSNLHGTTLKFINGNGNFAIQLCDNVEVTENHGWTAQGIVIKNMKIDCDKKVNNGINGNFNVILDNVVVVNAILDGIVLENYTYPFLIKNCFSNYNGRHGLNVKGNMSTIYNVYNSEFSRNDGFGIYITSGDNANFYSCVCQSNKAGGINISKLNNISYLSNINFYGMYTENNGLLQDTDEYYEGNYTIIINAISPSNDLMASKPANINFINSSLNNNNNTKLLKCNACWNLRFDKCKAFLTENNVDIDPNFTDVISSPNSLYPYSQVDNSIMLEAITIRGTSSKLVNLKNFVNVSKRGQTLIIPFYLDKISAGQTLTMRPFNMVSDYFPILESCVINGIVLNKPGNKNSVADKTLMTGSLTAQLFSATANGVYTGNGSEFSSQTVTYDMTNENTQIAYLINDNPVNFIVGNNKKLGIRLTASSDYHSYEEPNNSNYGAIIAYIIVTLI